MCSRGVLKGNLTTRSRDGVRETEGHEEDARVLRPPRKESRRENRSGGQETTKAGERAGRTTRNAKPV